jgi:hypothetical protein
MNWIGTPRTRRVRSGKGRTIVNARRLGRLGGLAVGLGIGAALAAPAAGAVTGTDVDPLEDLFGTGGTNTWTTTADTDLATLSPTLAGDLDASVDSFEAGFNPPVVPDDPFSLLAWDLDMSAFSANPGLGGLPDNAIGDFAAGLDYTLFASGLGEPLTADIDALFFLLLLPIGGL